MTGIILEKVQQFQNEGSGWVFENIESFDINIDPFEPLSGSSYISLPKNLEDKKAITLEMKTIMSASNGLLLLPSIKERSTRKG